MEGRFASMAAWGSKAKTAGMSVLTQVKDKAAEASGNISPGKKSSLVADLKKATHSEILDIPKDLIIPVVEASKHEDDGEANRKDIMKHLRECLAETESKNWRRIFAALVLTDALVKDGSPLLITETAEGRHFDLVQRLSFLEHFSHSDSRITSQIRKKAEAQRQQVVPLIQNAAVRDPAELEELEKKRLEREKEKEKEKESSSTASPGTEGQSTTDTDAKKPSEPSSPSVPRSGGGGFGSDDMLAGNLPLPADSSVSSSKKAGVGGVVNVGHNDDTDDESDAEAGHPKIEYRPKKSKDEKRGDGNSTDEDENVITAYIPKKIDGCTVVLGTPGGDRWKATNEFWKGGKHGISHRASRNIDDKIDKSKYYVPFGEFFPGEEDGDWIIVRIVKAKELAPVKKEEEQSAPAPAPKAAADVDLLGGFSPTPAAAVPSTQAPRNGWDDLLGGSTPTSSGAPTGAAAAPTSALDCLDLMGSSSSAAPAPSVGDDLLGGLSMSSTPAPAAVPSSGADLLGGFSMPSTAPAPAAAAGGDLLGGFSMSAAPAPAAAPAAGADLLAGYTATPAAQAPAKNDFDPLGMMSGAPSSTPAAPAQAGASTDLLGF